MTTTQMMTSDRRHHKEAAGSMTLKYAKLQGHLNEFARRSFSAGKIDTGFAVSARCIFVHKNNLACLPKFSCRQVPHVHSEEKASELGFLEPTDFHTPSDQP